MRIAIGLEYDGSSFRGFQRQKNLRTVQSTLETALSQIANQPIQTICAGRTDQGVHALQQVIHFDTSAARNSQAWTRGTNSLLPSDIVLHWTKVVDSSFHARFSALNRRYLYTIDNSSIRPALFRNYVTHFPFNLDEKIMQKAAKCLIGEHDFSSFRGADCQSKKPTRRIDSLHIYRENMFVLIDITANAFLHHMVRNIVGALFLVGTHKRNPDWLQQILMAQIRTSEFITAPAHGLYLVQAAYPLTYHLPTQNTAFTRMLRSITHIAQMSIF